MEANNNAANSRITLNINLLFTAFNITFNAWVFSVLWNWLLVPKLGFLPINTAFAVGLRLLAIHLNPNYKALLEADDKKPTEVDLDTFLEKILKELFLVVAVSCTSLLIGWLAHFGV